MGLFLFGVLRWIYVNRIARYMAVDESKLIDRQQEIVATIDPPKIEGIPLQSIEVRADEARFVLRAADFLSRWSQRTMRSRLVNKLTLFGVIPFLVMCLYFRIPQELFSHSWTEVLPDLTGPLDWVVVILVLVFVILLYYVFSIIFTLLIVTLNHLVGADKQRSRDFNPERLCGLEVEKQFRIWSVLAPADRPA